MTIGGVCPVGKLERVLLATDRSEFSEGAVREAINFATKCSSRLTVTSVLETNPEYETIGSKFFEKEENEARNYLESVKTRASSKDILCDVVMLESDAPARAIVDFASQKNADMIIVGRRGRKGLAKLLIGEVSSKIIGHAYCKVLVVPRAAVIEYRTILVATDGSTHGSAAVTEALAIAKRCGSHLIVLSAVHDGNGHEAAESLSGKAVELAKKEGVSAESLTPIGRSADVIVETAGGRGVDLIVMGTYGKTGVKKLLMGSTTEKVIRSAGCAVLVVKAS